MKGMYLSIDRMDVNYLVSKESGILNMQFASLDNLGCMNNKTRNCDNNYVKVENSVFNNVMT